MTPLPIRISRFVVISFMKHVVCLFGKSNLTKVLFNSSNLHSPNLVWQEKTYVCCFVLQLFSRGIPWVNLNLFHSHWILRIPSDPIFWTFSLVLTLLVFILIIRTYIQHHIQHLVLLFRHNPSPVCSTYFVHDMVLFCRSLACSI